MVDERAVLADGLIAHHLEHGADLGFDLVVVFDVFQSELALLSDAELQRCVKIVDQLLDRCRVDAEVGLNVGTEDTRFERFDVAKYGGEGGPLHDPCVVAWLLRPDLFGGKRVNVEVETASELTRGMTVADWWGVSGRAPNATWVRDVDAEGLFALLVERLGRL